MSYDQAADALRKAATVTVTTHLNPDGDGIGAGLALVHGLERIGKRVRFLCPSRVASLYAFLPGFARIEPILEEAQARALPPTEVLISCDCGDRKRLGAVMAAPRATLINLDHHATNDRFGDINLVDVAAESSGVVAHGLLERLGVAIDPLIATCLYTTIVYDTGRFMHSNTTAHTFRWTAALLDVGIDAAEINRRLTYTRTPHDLAIIRLGLEHLRVDEEVPALAGIAIPAARIREVGEPEDWGDLVDVPRTLQGNRVAYLLREQDGGKAVRASLRSNPPWQVGPVAQAFGGGGHLQAAGCTIEGDLAQALGTLLPRLRAAARSP